MNVLVDMNLSPAWVGFLEKHGIAAKHWSSIGACAAPDSVLFSHAEKNGMVIFTNDLDFGTILFRTKTQKPSVIQVRAENLLPADVGETVVNALRQMKDDLRKGCILTILPNEARIRKLPL